LTVETTARGATRFSLCVPVCVTKEGVRHVLKDVKEGGKPIFSSKESKSVESEIIIRPVSDEVEEGEGGPNLMS